MALVSARKGLASVLLAIGKHSLQTTMDSLYAILAARTRAAASTQQDSVSRNSLAQTAVAGVGTTTAQQAIHADEVRVLVILASRLRSILLSLTYGLVAKC